MAKPMGSMSTGPLASQVATSSELAERKRLTRRQRSGPSGSTRKSQLAATQGRVRVEILGIREMPRSGKPTELMKYHGITADAIVAAVRRLL